MKQLTLNLEKRNILTTLANQLITTACGILIPRILITAYGSGPYGITVSITQFLSYISLLESGIGGVARGKLYGPLARGEKAEVRAVYEAVKRFFRFVAAAFLVYSLALGLFYRDLAHVEEYSRGYIFCLVLIIGLSTLAKYMGGLANLTLIVADQRQYVVKLITAAAAVVNTAMIVLLVRWGKDLIWVKLVSSMIFVLPPVFYALYVRWRYRLPKSSKRAVLEQKWTGIGQHLAYFLHTNTDVVLLTVFADVKLVAVYAVYSLVVNSIRAITESFSGGMEARFGELIAKNETQRLRAAIRRYQSLICAVTLVLFCCAGILIVPFVKLYTRQVTDADYVRPAFALVLVLAEAVNCLALPCASLPVAAARLRQTRWGAYGEAILNVALSCLLIRWDPLLGVALGTFAATVFRALYYIRYSAKTLLGLSAVRLTAELFAELALLAGGIVAGRAILAYVTITNYLQWALCGAGCFVLLSLPAAAILLSLRKRHATA